VAKTRQMVIWFLDRLPVGMKLKIKKKKEAKS
jgi:hypothetical protein